VVQKEGLTVTVQQGVADAQHTVLLARVEGYPRERYRAQIPSPTCNDRPRLVSSDGTVQDVAKVGESSDEQNDAIFYVRYEFLAMPAKPLDATLEIPCLMWDKNYKDWSIPLHFQVAQGANQVASLIELPTSPPTQPIPTSAATSAATPATESAPAGFSVVLKSVAELKDGYVLSGSYQWSDTRIDKSALVISDSNITDARGQDVPFDEVDTDPLAVSGPQEIPFAHQIKGKKFAWPLNITVIAISVIQPGQATFQFDAGPNPHAGQTWDVNIDVPVGQHIIHVEKIQVFGGTPPDPPNVLGFEFTMTSDPAVASALVRDLNPIIDCKSNCGGGGGGGGQDFGVSGFDGAIGPFADGWAAKDYSPAGLKTFVISDVSVFFKGPWQVQWQPSPP